jgi:riboflavin kinase
MDILTLTAIAKQARHRAADVSSGELARELEVSQQTASRRIKVLESEGYIVREIRPRGQRVKLTPKGTETLRRLYLDLEKALKDLDSHVYDVTGEIVSGMGEGKYYMELDGYKKQFKKKLGFTPYPGTLNLKLKSEVDIRGRQILQDTQGIEIEGFKSGERTFGAVKCFMAKIDGVKGAVIIPMRTHHGFNTLEIIAPEKIRDKIGLNEGDEVTVKVIT